MVRLEMVNRATSGDDRVTKIDRVAKVARTFSENPLDVVVLVVHQGLVAGLLDSTDPGAREHRRERGTSVVRTFQVMRASCLKAAVLVADTWMRSLVCRILKMKEVIWEVWAR